VFVSTMPKSEIRLRHGGINHFAPEVLSVQGGIRQNAQQLPEAVDPTAAAVVGKVDDRRGMRADIMPRVA
jgi:hypothetical protein